MTRLEQIYRDSVAGQLQQQFSYKSSMEIPKITKVTLNMGVGEASQDKKAIEGAVQDLSLIAGQRPVITVAKRAIAGFKIREGMTIGCKVTLRRDKMYEFLDRLINFSIPRIRDFRGLSPKAFDGQGNYNMGIAEQIAFPEIDYDKIDKLRGLNISITTSARTDEEGRALLTAFQFPFKS
jgi:large subunit ribosomal protein L5